MVTKLHFGVRLKQLRKEKKLTQEELAVRIGRSVDALSNIERGKSLPNFTTIEQLAQALDVPLKNLFDFDEHPFRNAGCSCSKSYSPSPDSCQTTGSNSPSRRLKYW